MTLHQFFSRSKLDADLTEEMREHQLARIDELVAQGVPLVTARETARREFGNFTLLEERGREVWRWLSIEAFLRDIRFAARRLLQSPGFTVVCGLTLALGLGGNLAMFTLIRSVLLKPLPFKAPGRLVMLYENDAGHFKSSGNVVAAASFADWQRDSHGFAEMAMWSWGSSNLAGNGGQLPEKIETRDCTWNFFHTLGVQPAYGRFFSPADDQPGAPATTILAWGLFERRFGGNPDAVGQTVLLDNQRYTVIGVLPAWFVYPDRKGQLWTPAYRNMPAEWAQSHGIHAWNVIARLKNGVSAAAAVAETASIQAHIHKQFPGDPAAESVSYQPLIDDMVGEFKTPLYVLLAAVGCVLLITCLNVASLLLARSFARRKEIAVRSALGGSAWHIMREQLMESLLLAAGSGVLAIGVAYSLVQWAVRVRNDLPRTESLQVDTPLLAFGICLTVLTALMIGFLPAAFFRRGSILSVLQEASRSVKSGRFHTRLRKYLVGIEVAFTAVLLIGAGLLLKSFVQLRAVNLGCTTKNILTMGFSLPEIKYKNPLRAAVFVQDLLTRVRSLPGVESAGVISTLPGAGYSGDTMFTIPEHPELTKRGFQFAIFREADGGAFTTLQIPVLRGRVFTDQDRQDKSRRVIINDAFAKKFFPHEDPVGRHLRGNWDDGPSLQNQINFEIVGVVGDTRYRITQPVKPMMYLPPYEGLREASLVIRGAGDPTSLALPIQKIFAQLDHNLGVADILTLDQVIGQSVSGQSFETIVIIGFAALSLLLASIGLYGALSYVVAQRTSEFGIRIALGAQRGELISSTLLNGLKPAAFGLLFGLAGGVAAARLIQSILFGVTPTDVAVLISVPILILLVATLACALPAIRASSVDPITALRTE